MKFILLAIILIFSSSANEGNFLTSIDVESDSQCVINGTTVYKKKYNEIFIAKVDSFLNLSKMIELPQKRNKQGKGLIEDANKNLIVLSIAYNDQNNSNLRLTKLDTNNTIIWDNTYENKNNLTAMSSFKTPMVQTTDESFFILSRHHTPSSKSDILLYKIDRNGKKLWEKSFGTKEEDRPLLLLEGKDDTCTLFYYVEIKRDGFSAYSLIIEKMDNNGNRLWSTAIYKKGTETKNENYVNIALQSAVHTKNGGYILSGTAMYSTISENIALKYILKIDAKGNTIWEKSVKGEDSFSKLVYLFSTNSEYTSFAITKNGKDELYVSAIKFNDNGLVSKVVDYKEPKMSLMRIIALKDNGFIVVGGRHNKKKETELFVFKVDKNLDVLWKQQLGTLPYVYGLPIIKERPDGKVIIGYTYKKDEKSKFQIQLNLLDENGTVLKTSSI